MKSTLLVGAFVILLIYLNGIDVQITGQLVKIITMFFYISNLVGLCYGLLSSHRRLDHGDDDFFIIWHIVNRPEDIPVGVWACL